MIRSRVGSSTDIDDRLLIEVKTIAAASGRTLTAVVEDALRESVARRRAVTRVDRVELPTHRGGGVQPGIDLDDTAALLEAMDGPPR